MANNLKKSQYVMQTAQTAEALEFSTMFGSNANPKWFEWLMKQSGTYLFSFALFLSVLKLGISIYQFVKNPNKNVNQSSSLAWNIFHTGLIGTAIIGALAAATTFAVITPILFVSAMGLDTLRNLGLLLWNTGKLASLRYSMRKEVNDPEDEFSKIKYAALKEKYLSNIKQHAMGSVIGLIMTAATSIIFLFPHVGLGAVAATTITIGSIKLTAAGIAGLAATSALIAPLIPSLKNLASWVINKSGLKNQVTKLFNFFKSKFTNEDKQNNLIIENESEQQPFIQPIKIEDKNSTVKKPDFKITNIEMVDMAMQHKVNFSAFSLHNRMRETIIDHIDDKELATTTLHKMLDEKIRLLVADLQKGKNSGYRYFAEMERPKREQKLHALLLIKQQLQEHEGNIFTDYKDIFKNYALLNKNRFADLSTLLNYIENNLPGIKKSFFLDQSDTQNIVEALKHYEQKFNSVKQMSLVS